MVTTWSSVGCAEIQLVNVLFQLDSRHSGLPIRLVSALRGFLPKCIWKSDIFNLLCGVCLIVFIAKCTLSSNIRPSAMFALVGDLIDRIVRSTKPVPVCKLGVHLIRLMFSLLQNCLYSLLLKQLPLSVLIHCGVPLSAKYFVRNFKTVRVSVLLQICAVGHLLKRSMATKLYTSPRDFNLVGPAKSNWISWFGSVKISRLFFPLTGFA